MLSLIQLLINEYHKQFNNNRVCVVPGGYIIRTTEQNIYIPSDRELIKTLRYDNNTRSVYTVKEF